MALQRAAFSPWATRALAAAALLCVTVVVAGCGAVSPLVGDPRLDCGDPPAGECATAADAALLHIGVSAAQVDAVRVVGHDCRQLGTQLFRFNEFALAQDCWTVDVEHGAVLESVIVHRPGDSDSLAVSLWER